MEYCTVCVWRARLSCQSFMYDSAQSMASACVDILRYLLLLMASPFGFICTEASDPDVKLSHASHSIPWPWTAGHARTARENPLSTLQVVDQMIRRFGCFGAEVWY